MRTYEEGKRCLFGRQHIWSTGLAAALNSNYDAELPSEPEWVWWCSVCETIGPWSVAEELAR